MLFPFPWGVNPKGLPTTDPRETLEGALLPFGGIKGAHLSLLISFLCGPLIGGLLNHKVVGTRYMEQKPNKGDLFICLDVNSFTNLPEFKKAIDSAIEIFSDVSEEYRVPGHRSLLLREKNLKEGVILSRKFLNYFKSKGNI